MENYNQKQDGSQNSAKPAKKKTAQTVKAEDIQPKPNKTKPQPPTLK